MKDDYLCTLAGLVPEESRGISVQDEGVGIIQKPNAYIELRRWGKPFIPLGFQKQIIEGLGALLDRGATSGLLSLPTGSGKTLTASRVVLHAMSKPSVTQALWIAPQRELLLQAAEAFQTAWWSGAGPDSLNIRVIESARDLVLDAHPSCWLMTPAMAKKALDEFAGNVGVVTFDEAHHAAAEMFGEVWNTFRNAPQQQPHLCLGLSATPQREKRVEALLLIEAFGGTLFLPRELGAEPIKKLIEMGVLGRPTFRLIEGVPEYARRADLSDTRALRTLVTDPHRWSAVVRCLQQCEAGQVVVYALDRDHGRTLTRHLRYLGERAEYVDGEVSLGIRMGVFERFRNRQTRILVNVALMIEGVDCPTADSVLFTYPVNSSLRMRQMVGRVLRGHAIGGTAECRIWSVDGSTQSLNRILDTKDQRMTGWKVIYLPD